MKIERSKNENGETIVSVSFVLPSTLEDVVAVQYVVDSGLQAGELVVTLTIPVPKSVPWKEYDRIVDIVASAPC